MCGNLVTSSVETSGGQSYTNKMAEKVLSLAGVCQVERSLLGM